MIVIFSGSLSEGALRLAARVSERLRDQVDNLEVLAWMFTEQDETPSGGSIGDLNWSSFDASSVRTVGFSRESLSSYRKLVSEEDYPAFFALSLKLFNRRDFTGTFRLLEREVLLQNATLTALDHFLTFKPNLVVFPVTPHLLMPSVARYVCRFLSIPILELKPCPLAPAVFPFFIDENGERLIDVPAEFSLSSEIKEIVAKELAALASFKDPMYMQLQRRRDFDLRSNRSRMKSALRSFRWLKSVRYRQAIDFSGFSESNSLFFRALRVVLTRKLQLELRNKVRGLNTTVSTPENYCLFALHYEPERTSLPEGLPILFQPDAVAIASAIIPDDTTLIVKEHYSQVSSALRGFLGRSPATYDLLASYDNVKFASVDGYLSDLVDRARCVFTLTGTIAIESALKGVPVGYFGTPWWDGMPGTVRVEAATQFEEILAGGASNPSAVLSFLKERLQLYAIPGLGSESVQTLERRLGSLPNGLEEDEASSLAAVIHTLLSSLELAQSQPKIR